MAQGHVGSSDTCEGHQHVEEVARESPFLGGLAEMAASAAAAAPKLPRQPPAPTAAQDDIIASFPPGLDAQPQSPIPAWDDSASGDFTAAAVNPNPTSLQDAVRSSQKAAAALSKCSPTVLQYLDTTHAPPPPPNTIPFGPAPPPAAPTPPPPPAPPPPQVTKPAGPAMNVDMPIIALGYHTASPDLATADSSGPVMGPAPPPGGVGTSDVWDETGTNDAQLAGNSGDDTELEGIGSLFDTGPEVGTTNHVQQTATTYTATSSHARGYGVSGPTSGSTMMHTGFREVDSATPGYRVAPGLAGLLNLGNTCYMNSSL